MQKYLIFGATGSVGSNLAKQLSQANKEIHLIGRNAIELEKLSLELGCDYTILDILSDDIYENLKKIFENIDLAGIAYCIGSIDLKPLEKTNKEDFQKCLKLNFFPIVEVIKVFQGNLKKNKGSIVLFSTVAVQRGFTNHSIIASVKGAIEGLTVSLAAEFAPNIKVNCIAPSLTNSKLAEPILKNKIVAEGIAKAHPLKRIGEGKDTAAMAKFLLTEESSWITGQIIGVDGGRSTLA
jgi:NAD(P)-dependent dehydrogenase (short-subunit alcohol dehydrogenase family)